MPAAPSGSSRAGRVLSACTPPIEYGDVLALWSRPHSTQEPSSNRPSCLPPSGILGEAEFRCQPILSAPATRTTPAPAKMLRRDRAGGFVVGKKAMMVDRRLMGEWYEQLTIGQLPERASRQWGAREALAFQGQRWTFAELSARVDATAKGLLQLGILPGDKVALWMVNRPEWIDAMFAVMKIGAVLVPVNSRFRRDDMAYVLGQSDAVAMLLAERSGPVDYLAMIRDVVPDLGARPDARFPALRHVVVLSERAISPAVGWQRMVEDGRRVTDDALRARAAAVDPGQPGFFFYTSGTTGFPKAAVHDHRIVGNTWDQGERMRIGVDDVILMYLPLFHIFGFIHGALMSMIRGARLVLTETF